MARPASDWIAAQRTRDLLIRRLPGRGSRTTRSHLARAEFIGREIWRWRQIGPYQWQVNHLRWFLERKTNRLTPGVRYRYWLTVRLLVVALGREADWLPHLLKGTWIRPSGETGPLGQGRPVRLPR